MIRSFNVRLLLPLLVVAALLIAWRSVARRNDDALVVYCAHDLMFAQEILDDFERATGIQVAVVGDTEATKSLGLVQRIIREKRYPQCDVFWNNQLLGTMQLAEEGLLEPYMGPGFRRIPEQYKDRSGLWTGFAGRLRVWIVNRELMEPTEEAIAAVEQADDLAAMCIAQPIYGTTLSHCSILWEQWGAEHFQEWYRSFQQRGGRIVPGNATVKNLVAEGVCQLGWTDTDDYFVGRDAGAPVELLPIRVEGKTICIPNSVAIVRGTQRKDAAQKLIDYLLSAEVELKLAQSEARQIPLGRVDEAQIPEEVRPLVEWAREGHDLRTYAAARMACLEWLLDQP